MNNENFETSALEMVKHIRAQEEETGVSVPGIVKEIESRKLYEEAYGIFPHYRAKKTGPFDIAKARAKDEIYLYSNRAMDYDKYLEYDMFKLTGLDIERFFDLPCSEIDLLFKIAKRKANAADKNAKQDDDKLRQLLEQMGGQKK